MEQQMFGRRALGSRGGGFQRLQLDLQGSTLALGWKRQRAIPPNFAQRSLNTNAAEVGPVCPPCSASESKPCPSSAMVIRRRPLPLPERGGCSPRAHVSARWSPLAGRSSRR